MPKKHRIIVTRMESDDLEFSNLNEKCLGMLRFPILENVPLHIKHILGFLPRKGSKTIVEISRREK